MSEVSIKGPEYNGYTIQFTRIIMHWCFKLFMETAQ